MASKVKSCRKIDAEDADTGATDDCCDKPRPSMKRAVSWEEPAPDSPAFSAIKPNHDFLSPHPSHPVMEIGESFPFGPPRYDLQSAAIETAHSGLARKLKGRHLQMIAIGGSVGRCRESRRTQGTSMLNHLHRYRPFCGFWQSPQYRRPCVSTVRRRHHWHHAILYVPGHG